MINLLTALALLGLATYADAADPLAPITAPKPKPTIELLTTIPEPVEPTESAESAESAESTEILKTVVDEREQHWANLGYTLRFNHSVTEADYGRTGEDFLTDRNGWANGNTTHTNWIDESLITFTTAPDGTPAMRSIIGVGQQQSLNWRGQQLGQENTDKDAVFSIQVWMESPRSKQSYIGAGHYWGSAPGVTHTGGAATNHPDSWSIRAIHALDGTMRGYGYLSLPKTATSYGDVYHGTQKLPLGKWVTLETEVVANNPPASDGTIRTIVDQLISNEETGKFIRNASNVYPKGMGMLIRNNARAQQTETIYIRNWRIYTKP